MGGFNNYAIVLEQAVVLRFVFWKFLWGCKTLMEGQSRDGEAIVFLLFSGHFCGAGRGLDGGRQSHDGGYPSPPPTKTL